MGQEEYLKARKLGLKAVQNAVANGKNPNLPVLADIIPNIDAMGKVPLGVMEIPLNRVVGTTTAGRTSSFACNFMPLLEVGTEFANKWSALYNSVIQDGIRDAVKAMEYLGEYYLVEGNKRVCMAKYLGMEYIDADVTRIMPDKNSSERTKAYYEFIEFSKKTGLSEPIFTTVGQYDRLLKLLRRHDSGPFLEEERKDFLALYHYFATSYQTVMEGNHHAIPESEAFLVFLVAYGYTEVVHLCRDDILEKVNLMKWEFVRISGGKATSLILDREEPYTLKPAFLRPSSVKAAFLYTRSSEDSGWNYWHELGRINAEEAMDGKLITKALIISSRNQFNEEVHKLIQDDYRLIFATSPVMLNSCIAPSLEHPNTKFFCCSAMSSYQNIRSYYMRFYEAKFLLGIAAGIYARNGKIGYVGDYPIIGSAATINAFARGVAMVNPMARIYLEWSCKESFNSSHPFSDPDIHVISNRDINAPSHSSLEYSLYMKEGDNLRNLGAMVMDWSRFYTHFADQYLKGRMDEDANDTSLSYWWGMNSDALQTILSTHFDTEAARLIQYLKKEIKERRFEVFEGEWKNQTGEWMSKVAGVMNHAEIICMDQLASNVIGNFPTMEELSEEAIPVVKLQGRNGEVQPDVRSFHW